MRLSALVFELVAAEGINDSGDLLLAEYSELQDEVREFPSLIQRHSRRSQNWEK